MIAKKVPKADYTITIENITVQDAEALLDIMGVVGGDPAGPRGAASRLSYALSVIPGLARGPYAQSNVKPTASGPQGIFMHNTWQPR